MPSTESAPSTAEQMLDSVTPRTAREYEIEEKSNRLHNWLDQNGLDAVLLRRHENIAWATAGQVEARVAIPSETAVVALLLTRQGRRYYFAPENEAPRMAAEEFAGLGYEAVTFPWHAADLPHAVKQIADLAKVASDMPFAGTTQVNLTPLRAPLTAPEIDRYRWLAHETAAAVEEALVELEPGITEHEMEALVGASLLATSILPSVLLMAVDDRILKYKHAVARGAALRRFGMLNLCTRKWGLAVSITRFVHFGPLPAELASGFNAAAKVNAALQHATREGATAAQLFSAAQQAYAEAGYPGEEQLHHQGGACGYVERDWVATPSGTQVVTSPQAFAWNPSVRGGKVEDTTLLANGRIEVLTATPTLPQVETIAGGIAYHSAGVLIR